MKVVLLNERCHRHPRAGGAEVHLFEIFSRLVERGIETELLCSNFRADVPVHEEHRGLQITRLGMGLLAYYRRIVCATQQRAAQGAVVVEALNKVPFLSPLYARGPKGSAPVVAIHHHLFGSTAFRQVAWPVAAGVVALERLLPLVYQRVPFVTISESSRQDLVRRGIPESHVEVVPCGVDLDLHQPGPTTGRGPVLLSLGRLELSKRIDHLLRSLLLVRRAEPRTRLWIVGQGPAANRLRTLSANLGLDEFVTFTGFVDEATKVTLLQRAALLVQCSEKEGWGLTVSEAAACGTPAVATDVPGLCDAVRHEETGLLVPDGPPAVLADRLASTIVRLLTDEPLRLRLAAGALAFARTLSWDAAAEAIGAVLERAARRSSPSNLFHPVPGQPLVAGGSR